MAVRHALPASIREILAVTSAPVALVASIYRLLRRLLHWWSCSGCEIGKYKAEAGNELCTSCRTTGRATTLSAGSTSVTDCRCLPGSTGADGQDCTSCETGKYKITVGAEECALCAAGT